MRSHNFFCLPILTLLLTGIHTDLLLAQTSVAEPQSAAQHSSPVLSLKPQTVHAGPDYQQKESQPNLKVDRDPVLSPMPADNAPWGTQPQTQSQIIQKSKSNVYTLREDVNEVVLNCTVLNQKNKLVLNLAPANFQIWEDGVPQTIASFQYRDVPVSMGILIDNSASMQAKRDAVNQAALTLVRDSNPHDRAFIVNFSDNAYLDQGPTSNIDALQSALEHYRSGGTTAIYDAVYASANELSEHAEWPKQVLLVITDGNDNASRITLEQTIRRVERMGGPVVYSIGLLFDAESREQAKEARSALERLSADTGGFAFFPHSLKDVNGIAQQIAYDIRHQYIIGYHSTKPISQGGFRTVRVTAHVHGREKLIVRTRKGYYPGQIKQMHATRDKLSRQRVK
jgi:VWFA-related protein